MKFIKTAAEDAQASEHLQQRKVIGIDFEWKPDVPSGSNNRLALAQVCDGATCFIWCLFHFDSHGRSASGLHALLLNKAVLKVGCGMRGNDLAKLHHSGLPVCDPRLRMEKGKQKLLFTLPEHFVDVQDWKIGPTKNAFPPFKGLYHLLAIFLRRQTTVNANARFCDWTTVERSLRIQLYTVTDAYAVFLLWHTYHDAAHIAAQYLHRDDQVIMHKVYYNYGYGNNQPPPGGRKSGGKGIPPNVASLPPPDISGLFTDAYLEQLLHVEQTPEIQDRRNLHTKNRKLIGRVIVAEGEKSLKTKEKANAKATGRNGAKQTPQNAQTRTAAKKTEPVASSSNHSGLAAAKESPSSLQSSSIDTTTHASAPSESTRIEVETSNAAFASSSPSVASLATKTNDSRSVQTNPSVPKKPHAQKPRKDASHPSAKPAHAKRHVAPNQPKSNQPKQQQTQLAPEGATQPLVSPETTDAFVAAAAPFSPSASSDPPSIMASKPAKNNNRQWRRKKNEQQQQQREPQQQPQQQRQQAKKQTPPKQQAYAPKQAVLVANTVTKEQ